MSPLAPHEVAAPTGLSLLAIGPSLGELVLGCGGALAHAHAAHDPIHVLVPPGDSADAMAAVRELTGARILPWDPGRRVEALAQTLEAAHPGRVYCPSPLERAPARLDCVRALERALDSMSGLRPDVALYEVAERLRPNHRVDIAPVLTRKEAALARCAASPDLGALARLARPLALLRAADASVPDGACEAFHLARAEQLSSGLEALVRWAIWASDRPIAGPGGALVSVIVRTRDRPERLREALSCLALQTWPALEVVLVDSGRTSADAVVAPFARSRPIAHLKIDPRTTRGAALNAGIARSTGTWISYLDDDDAVMPHHVETLARALEAGPHRVAYVDAYTVSEKPGPDGALVRGPRQLSFDRAYSRAALLAANYIPIHCLMHDRALVGEAGGFDPELSGYEDWDLWIRMSRLADFHHVARATAEYRLREDAANRRTLAPSADEVRALAVIRARHAAERAGAWEQAYDELVAMLVRATERLEPLRLELEQLRGRCNGLERELERRREP